MDLFANHPGLTVSLFVSWISAALSLLDLILGGASATSTRPVLLRIGVNVLFFLPCVVCVCLAWFPLFEANAYSPSSPLGTVTAALSEAFSPSPRVTDALVAVRIPFVVVSVLRMVRLTDRMHAPFTPPMFGAAAFLGHPLSVAIASLGPLLATHILFLRLLPEEFALGTLLLLARRVLWLFTANRLPPSPRPVRHLF